MQNARIMIVEDERIIARDIQNRLEQLGYDVIAIASSGNEAIRKAAYIHPDLVLMDIVLKGDKDGVQTAEQIQSQLNIPLIYITAYADDGTLERAKTTEPCGYLLKPFHIKELRSSIEIALHKHRVESKLREETKWLDITLRTIGVGVIVTDTNGSVTFMNPVSEILTGWKMKAAFGKELGTVLKILNKNKEGQSIPKNLTKGPTILIDKEGREVLIDLNFTSLQDDGGNTIGAFIVLRDITERREARDNLKAEPSPEHRIDNIGLIVLSQYRLVQEAMQTFLGYEKDIKIIAQVSKALELPRVVEQKKPDVVFIDMDLPNLDMAKTLGLIKEKSKDTKTVLLLHTLDEDILINAFHLGVKGYLTDELSPAQFLDAIRTVSNDEIWLGLKVINSLLTKFLHTGDIRPALKAKLTRKEKEIAKYVMKGFSNKRISSELFISENTVKTHLANLFNKLSVSNRLELALYLRN
jgi:PAS domain S-box-containing protein